MGGGGVAGGGVGAAGRRRVNWRLGWLGGQLVGGSKSAPVTPRPSLALFVLFSLGPSHFFSRSFSTSSSAHSLFLSPSPSPSSTPQPPPFSPTTTPLPSHPPTSTSCIMR